MSVPTALRNGLIYNMSMATLVRVIDAHPRWVGSAHDLCNWSRSELIDLLIDLGPAE